MSRITHLLNDYDGILELESLVKREGTLTLEYSDYDELLEDLTAVVRRTGRAVIPADDVARMTKGYLAYFPKVSTAIEYPISFNIRLINIQRHNTGNPPKDLIAYLMKTPYTPYSEPPDGSPWWDRL